MASVACVAHLLDGIRCFAHLLDGIRCFAHLQVRAKSESIRARLRERREFEDVLKEARAP